MKTTLLLIAAALLCGCTSTKVSTPFWTMERRSFLQRVEVPQLTISTNGTATLSGYKNDGGNEALGVAVSAAVAAAIKSAKP